MVGRSKSKLEIAKHEVLYMNPNVNVAIELVDLSKISTFE